MGAHTQNPSGSEKHPRVHLRPAGRTPRPGAPTDVPSSGSVCRADGSALGPDCGGRWPHPSRGVLLVSAPPPPRLLLTPRRSLRALPWAPPPWRDWRCCLVSCRNAPGGPPLPGPQHCRSTASPLQAEPVAAVDTVVHRDPPSSCGAPSAGPPSPSWAPALLASPSCQQFLVSRSAAVHLQGRFRPSPPHPSGLSLNWHPCCCLP